MREFSPSEVFRTFIESAAGTFSEDDWHLLHGIIEVSEYEKNSDVLKIGHYCEHLYFLVDGAVLVHSVAKTKIRITHMFLSRSFFTDFMGMARKQPSALGFRTTEKSQIIRIAYPDLLQVYNKSHSMERIGRIMAERQFLIELHLRTLLLNHNSKDLYDYLIREQPAVFQHFSLKDIASFMGIAPESLSRLRRGG